MRTVFKKNFRIYRVLVIIGLKYRFCQFERHHLTVSALRFDPTENKNHHKTCEHLEQIPKKTPESSRKHNISNETFE